jgi:glycosyltransferase involved in cell wall biosynthesis
VALLPQGPAAWIALNDADITVFNIGNDPNTPIEIVSAALRYAGIVILHDLRLQHLLLGLAKSWPDCINHEALMESSYGREGSNAALAAAAGKVTPETLGEKYPLHQPFTDHSLGVLVHTQEALEVVRARHRCPIVLTPLPYPAHPRDQQRSLVSLEGRLARLVVFGFLGPNRRLNSILAALSDKELRRRFHLDIFGQIWSPETIKSWIVEYNLQENVKIHGFVDESFLDSALDQADIAINLRNPTMGEASGSQLRIWDHALPSLVSRTGWYQNLPASSVFFVRPDFEVDDLRRHLRHFLDKQEVFLRAGEAGRKFLEEHHGVDGYVKAIARLANGVQHASALQAANYLACQVAELAWPWCGHERASELTFSAAADHILEVTARPYNGRNEGIEPKGYGVDADGDPGDTSK